MNLPARLLGQDVPSVNSRAGQIQAERAQKAATLTPDEPGRTERIFDKAEDIAEGVFRGAPLRLQFGGLPGGSGFSYGPLIEWRNPSDLSLRLVAIGGFSGSYKTGAVVEKFYPNQSLRLTTDAAYVYANRLDYYGPGPDSLESNRTRYLLEETSADFGVRWQPPPGRFSAGVEAGGLFVNVGPGTSSTIPSTDAVFSPSEAPGIDEQTDFIRGGGYIDLDYRDLPRKPTDGTRALLRYQRYQDVVLERFSFNRLSAEVEHYIPFLNKKRVIALHAATELSFNSDDQLVPFYLQPTLGGPRTLRGFRRYRFYDDNSVVYNAEYRWEVSTGFEMALFADAGRVFDRPSEIARLSQMKTSAGFGARFNARERVALRIDTGFSNEGYRIWLQVTSAF